MRIYRRLVVGLNLVAALTLTGCSEPKRIAEQLPTPPERLVCERGGTRPAVEPEYQIDWARVLTVPQARLEHEKFVGVLRLREGVIAGYILKLEGINFLCWNNMEWRRQYEAGLQQ